MAMSMQMASCAPLLLGGQQQRAAGAACPPPSPLSLRHCYSHANRFFTHGRSSSPRQLTTRSMASDGRVGGNLSDSPPHQQQQPAVGCELPGGVWWASAPSGWSPAGLDLSSVVTGRGDGFVILGPIRPPGKSSKSTGLMKLDATQGRELALGCTFGSNTSPLLSTTDSQPPCTTLVPLSPDTDSPEIMGPNVSHGIVLRASLGQSPDTSLADGMGTKDGKQENSGVHRGSSPRRTQPVKFTCNICNTETIRVVNPHAWKHGTVFLECSGCHVKHKMVDNLNLFHELSGPVYSREAALDRLRGKLQDAWNLGDLGQP